MTALVNTHSGLPSSPAMNSLGLSLPDDDVRQGRTVLQDKHGISLAGLRLPLTNIFYSDRVNYEAEIDIEANLLLRSNLFIPPSKEVLTGMAVGALETPAEAGRVVVTA